jgi:predicted ATP-grasp superfamily ATP-dependent carboligase
MAIYELIERPDLEHPVLVLGLDGWIDAGLAGSHAVETITSGLDMATVATFDADVLLDHRARRPTMHLDEGINTGLTWPSIELRAATDRQGNEALLLLGVEPDHTWGAFSRAVVDLAVEFGCRMAVGLGAYPAPVPHTRATGVMATATTRELAEQVGYVHGRIDVPAGVHAAIERRCAEEGVPAVGLWAQVPHYAAAMPFPAGALVLVEALERVAGLDFDRGTLAAEADATLARLDALVSNSDEHVEMVRQLEVHVDALEAAEREGIPSGDELAAELERFLRDQET